jgi:hypothetical protein
VARDRLGLLSGYVTETIQGLSDLVAFQAVSRRRAKALWRRSPLSERAPAAAAI